MVPPACDLPFCRAPTLGMMGGGRKEEATMIASIRAAAPEDLDAIRRIARVAYAFYVPRIGREAEDRFDRVFYHKELN